MEKKLPQKTTKQTKKSKIISAMLFLPLSILCMQHDAISHQLCAKAQALNLITYDRTLHLGRIIRITYKSMYSGGSNSERVQISNGRWRSVFEWSAILKKKKKKRD